MDPSKKGQPGPGGEGPPKGGPPGGGGFPGGPPGGGGFPGGPPGGRGFPGGFPGGPPGAGSFPGGPPGGGGFPGGFPGGPPGAGGVPGGPPGGKGFPGGPMGAFFTGPETEGLQLVFPKEGGPPYLPFDGWMIPFFPLTDHCPPDKHVARVKNMPIRPDDIFICAFAKAGTHWVWEMTTMLLKGKADYDLRAKEVLMPDYQDPALLDKEPSPRVLNTHLPLDLMPTGAVEKGCKIIFISRNPKDIAVSQYNHLSGMKEELPGFSTFSESLKKFLDTSLRDPTNYFIYTKDWEEVLKKRTDLNVLRLNYEDMKEDVKPHLRRLAKFLGVDLSDSLCDEIADACSFKKLKKADEKKTDPFKDWYKEDFQGLYRKGEVGDWKNWFTVAESENFDRVFAREMEGVPIDFRYSL